MGSINHQQFINIAKEIAQSSKCVSMKVGALIVVDNRIRSMGYNGTPSGYHNCCDVYKERSAEHTAWSLDHEIHAELNAILYAASEGLSIKNGIVYSTHEPCKNCLKHMIASKISACIYEIPYYNESEQDKQIKRDFVKHCNFNLLQFRPEVPFAF